jgi:hypothetical protein
MQMDFKNRVGPAPIVFHGARVPYRGPHLLKLSPQRRGLCPSQSQTVTVTLAVRAKSKTPELPLRPSRTQPAVQTPGDCLYMPFTSFALDCWGCDPALVLSSRLDKTLNYMRSDHCLRHQLTQRLCGLVLQLDLVRKHRHCETCVLVNEDQVTAKVIHLVGHCPAAAARQIAFDGAEQVPGVAPKARKCPKSIKWSANSS